MEELDKHSRLLWWSVENFMSIKEAKVEFDDTNIINFKGFNDSGKSAMLRALEVLLSNKYPTEQAKFIKDGESYFRVMAGFSDGVVLLRDKYISGQSLYCMYKDNKEIFTTKQNGKYIKVTEVPEVIKQYVDFVEYDGTYLNSRSCFDPQLLVETSGSKNFKLLNSVLHSEELSRANQMLNTDKNTLIASRNSKEMEVSVLKEQSQGIPNFTAELIEGLENADSRLDEVEAGYNLLGNAKAYKSKVESVSLLPELEAVDTSRLDILVNLQGIQTSLQGLQDISLPDDFEPIEGTSQLKDLYKLKEVQENLATVEKELSSATLELSTLEGEAQLKDIAELKSSAQQLSQVDSSLDTLPAMGTLDLEKLNEVKQLLALAYKYMEGQKVCDTVESQLQSSEQELQGIMQTLSANNIKAVKCKNCGQLMLV